MYKVKYTKLAMMKDGTTGNISQGKGIAYMNCELYNLETMLANDLSGEDKDNKFHPIINNIEKVAGHIVI